MPVFKAAYKVKGGGSVSSVSKGKRFEKLVAERLLEDRHKIFFKSVFVRFMMIDFANMWDIVSFKQGIWHFLQCKSKKVYGEQLREYKLWKAEFGLQNMKFWLAIKQKKGKKIDILFEEI